MVYEKILKEIQNEFSNKQSKLFEKIQPLIGKNASIGLVSLQGVERTSQKEIEVIANLISQFSPIKIVTFDQSPRRIILSGQASKGHSVKIIPQYKVKNVNPKAQDWAIDLVIELYRTIGADLIKITSVGIEYDGHVSHYVESKVKSTYKRDVAIVSRNGIFSIRISPDSWKEAPDTIKKAIKKFFENQTKVIDNVQTSTINTIKQVRVVDDSEVTNLVTCPICIGRCRLAGDECIVCKGMGAVKEREAEFINQDNYNKFTCPDCSGITFNCSKCNDTGSISREKALEL
ncbi:hypothetical protein GLP37_02855 [Photobacterium phosphoreum]|uniref:hypothetical protein n=1 Tax=Photobacterium phosphoreum TaxID=659 RepID=UPI001E408322|nr:hypothetical protein [Photobacterium phosphoreum]MCD9501133.1 hypothetical protein [Photobacterium phosphoreum]